MCDGDRDFSTLWRRVLGIAAWSLISLAFFAASAGAGNRELMEDLARSKRKVRDQVLEKLRREGNLPRDGVVRFKAKVKPSLGNGEGPAVKIESLEISPSSPSRVDTASIRESGVRDPEGAEEEERALVKALGGGSSTEPWLGLGEIRFSGGEVVEERILVRKDLEGGGSAVSVEDLDLEGKQPLNEERLMGDIPSAGGAPSSASSPASSGKATATGEAPSERPSADSPGGAEPLRDEEAAEADGNRGESEGLPEREGAGAVAGKEEREEPLGWWRRFWRSVFP